MLMSRDVVLVKGVVFSVVEHSDVANAHELGADEFAESTGHYLAR